MARFMISSRISILVLALGLAVPWAAGSAASGDDAADPAVRPASASGAPPADGSAPAIAYLERKLRADPEDHIAHQKLALYYAAQTDPAGGTAHLERALASAERALQIFPAELNPNGLHTLLAVRLSRHEFGEARAVARQLLELAPDRVSTQRAMGEVAMEVGEYAEAREYLERARAGSDGDSVLEIELARLDLVTGRPERARARMQAAIERSEAVRRELPSTQAWLRAQLAELELSQGRYASAAAQAERALQFAPEDAGALGALGEARAALGETDEAIRIYERVRARSADPKLAAELGALYGRAGRAREASEQYAQVEAIAGRGGALYARVLARFLADRDRDPARAFELAQRDYAARPDVHGADTLAWTALRAGELERARSAIQEALRYGTAEAAIHYHAGLIARASGDRKSARRELERALQLSPAFDPLQAPRARQALAEL